MATPRASNGCSSRLAGRRARGVGGDKLVLGEKLAEAATATQLKRLLKSKTIDVDYVHVP